MLHYSKGSEWNKWDLHIHTPKSIVQDYGGDTDEAWEKFIEDLEKLPTEYKVIGINDYIFLDGYKKVLEFKENGRLQNINLVLPVIELRVNLFASIGDEAWKKINLHIIFSNNISPDIIEAQFLNAIQHSIKISPDIEGVDFKGIATKEALKDIGKKIKSTASVEINESDLKVGFSNIFFDYKNVIEKTQGFFKGNCLTAVGKSEWEAMRWEGSAALKKDLINDANFSFISLAKPVDHIKHLNALLKQNVRSMLLDCSDSHTFSTQKNKDRIGNSFTWLKADTTFEGLKQVSNDKSRIFIGDQPPLLARLESNKTKFIKSLNIKKIEGSTFNETWFDNFNLTLNPSMVAIIGNKGNGKSAIADTIGLVGNSPNFSFFSFLTENKFRKKKPLNKSEHFEASITWEDDTIDNKLLSENPSITSVEKIKYIPQGFLERLCNEEVDDFENELRKAIFSHLPDAEKFGKGDLNELIEYKTKILYDEIDILKKEIKSDNKSISELEKKQTDEFRGHIDEKLKEKNNELKVHESIKPTKIDPPSDPIIILQNKNVSDQIEIKRNELKVIDEDINEKQIIAKSYILEIEDFDRVLQNIDIFESQFEKLKTEIKPTLSKFKFDLNEIIGLSINKSTIDEYIKNRRKQLEEITIELGNINSLGLFFQRATLSNEIKELQDNLDKYSKGYQKYIDDLKNWEDKRSTIIGAKDKDDTIEFLNAQISYLENSLYGEIEVLHKDRMEKVKSLFSKKERVISLYKSLFRPVSEFISNYGDSLKHYNIQLDVDYKINGLMEKFFDQISLGAKGSFIGNPDGSERFKQILEKHELKHEKGIVSFLSEVLNNLKFDQREDFKDEKREIEKQLKKGYSANDLYNFLFSLDYLEPEYKLKLGDKAISELSPGERGALLLIFYLTLDKNDIPLVIDQPEENLDNQSVFTILVKFILEAKNKRQIIIITHNPNLAVACNAEQIVYLNINKLNGNEVQFISGSLENKIINDAVIDILEGTIPALNTRTNTYKVFSR